MHRVLLPESSVERGRRVNSKRKGKHVVERGRRVKSEQKHVEELNRKKQIRMAWADYNKRSRNLSVFDAIDPPAILKLCGGVCTYIIDESTRPLLTRYCQLALENYNQRNNQDLKFEFHDLVKSTFSLPGMFYITFKAKKQDASTTIFQAKVWRNIRGPIEVKFCAIKKD